MRRDDLLDLNEVLQHPGRKLEVDISSELPQEKEIELIRPLEGYLEAVSTGNLLLLTGKFEGAAILECARCGGPLETPFEFEIEEQFPVVGVASSYSSQDYARVDAEEEPYPLFEGNSLLVEDLLRQDMIVALPVQPLCQYGWEGPCPVAAARGTERRRQEGQGEGALGEAMKKARKGAEDKKE
jgi:uncharacterized protein